MPLFRKWYIDTFLMPASRGYRYAVHARCLLSSYPEGQKLRAEAADAIASFLWERILCRYGPVEEIVTDNAPQYIVVISTLRTLYWTLTCLPTFILSTHMIVLHNAPIRTLPKSLVYGFPQFV